MGGEGGGGAEGGRRGGEGGRGGGESGGEGVSSDSWQPIGYIKEDNYSDYHHCRGDHYICSLPFLKRSLVLVSLASKLTAVTRAAN